MFKSSKRPKNLAEQKFYDYATSKKWIVTKRGWPDFFCYEPETGKIVLVEVKRKRGHRLKREQVVLLKLLSEYLPCYRWTPDGGFEKIDGSFKF